MKTVDRTNINLSIVLLASRISCLSLILMSLRAYIKQMCFFIQGIPISWKNAHGYQLLATNVAKPPADILRSIVK